jgi:uncharacterized protein YqhQ
MFTYIGSEPVILQCYECGYEIAANSVSDKDKEYPCVCGLCLIKDYVKVGYRESDKRVSEKESSGNQA